MQIRRPLAALLAALALFGGGSTLTACGDWGPTTPNEGPTDEDSGGEENNRPGGLPEDDLPDNSDPEDSQDLDEDTSDPD
ncbi:hypothetical protein [Blastococcus goldschmidtiae]|uniref:Uncharacterized protein n=1 Tax=Blastococcus goldschmidtiae TaxID=3075546 RepID=A0ABU2KA47_9ACTN|nr:hypothetical protein [Blastococcus sp. DSM 46792]MDT0277057.1 hypothetical protein [Blastococcus sp. DSM 46792]